MQGAAGKADKAKDMLKEGAMRARKKLGREKDKTCRVHVKARVLLCFSCTGAHTGMPRVL